jgi:hypothetical protein
MIYQKTKLDEEIEELLNKLDYPELINLLLVKLTPKQKIEITAIAKE